ncbi:MAG: sugar-phosphate isomerase, RpiB/LacA/LacB family [Segetibacter sp.]|nr:sugar-phosphate isomerase, RpiB/LacA/LacB family [Segetibacter sp.]
MKIGIAGDHGGFQLKQYLSPLLKKWGHEIVDFGASEQNDQDDYPDFVIPLAKAIANKEVDRGIAVCGSGVGASIAANKVHGVRSALVHDHFSAHQGVEDDDMNMLCLGGRVVGNNVAQEIVETFLKAEFTKAERHMRRLQKVQEVENSNQ